MKKIMSKALCLTVFLLLVLSPVLCLGQEIDQNLKELGQEIDQNLKGRRKSPIVDMAMAYMLALAMIEKNYYQELTTEQIEAVKKVQEESLSKITGLLDKNSRYHSVEEYQEIKEKSAGGFEGVGLRLLAPDIKDLHEKFYKIIKEKIPEFDSVRDPAFIEASREWIIKINPEAKKLHDRITKQIIPEEGILIGEVMPKNPAERAGIKKGWYIVKADAQKVEGMPLEEAIKLIKGPKGTKVKLTLHPPKDAKGLSPITVEVERGVVKTSLISKSEMLNSETGYIKFTDFYETLNQDFKNKVADLKLRGMKNLVIDLRGNPGGLLHIADKILEVLLPAGRIEIYAKHRDGKLEPYWSPPESIVPKIFSGKIAVLIDGTSASASELVASSLKEQGIAVIIGEKSYGKASIQSIEPLPDGSALRLTVGHYLSPVSGEDIHEKGVIPDIEISDNPDTSDDEVIQKTLEIFKK